MDSTIILSFIACSNDGWSSTIYNVDADYRIILTPQKHQRIYYTTTKDLRNCDSIYLESGDAKIMLENRIKSLP